jgi:hypothetical protein
MEPFLPLPPGRAISDHANTPLFWLIKLASFNHPIVKNIKGKGPYIPAMVDPLTLARLERHLQSRYGVKNTKGELVFEKKCHLDTILLARSEHSEIWQSLTIEPVKEHENGAIFRIICEIEEDLPSVGVSKKSRAEELVFTGESLPEGQKDRMTILPAEP